MGVVKDDQAAGRVFCTQGQEYMAWTQNDGRMMGYVAGPVHSNVSNWWVAVHHNIGIGGAPMNMGQSERGQARLYTRGPFAAVLPGPSSACEPVSHR